MLQKDLWRAVQLPDKHRCLAAINLAIARGASPNAVDHMRSGATALHHAATNPDAEAAAAAVVALIRARANVHAKAKRGGTPLVSTAALPAGRHCGHDWWDCNFAESAHELLFSFFCNAASQSLPAVAAILLHHLCQLLNLQLLPNLAPLSLSLPSPNSIGWARRPMPRQRSLW